MHISGVREIQERIAELERSNAELRALLILTGREMRKHGYGKKDTPLLRLMRVLCGGHSARLGA
jgi:hypothetical protein